MTIYGEAPKSISRDDPKIWAFCAGYAQIYDCLDVRCDSPIIPTDKDVEAKKFVLEFFSVVAKDNFFKLKNIAETSTVPTFAGVSGAVDFRPIFDKPFGTNYITNVEEYNPSCIGWVPVLVINFMRDDRSFDNITFQCSETQLKIIIDYLTSLKKDLEMAKSSFPDKELLNNVD